jgi:hypothetical protein
MHVGPSHDAVDLSGDELRALGRLEDAYRRGSLEQVDSNRRIRLLHAVLPLARFAPWLIPFGAALIAVTISVSLVISCLGASFLAFGLVAALHRLPLRARRIRRGVSGRR